MPVRREGASAVDLDENIAVYDDVGQLMILLNSSAGAVWKLCDGSTTVDEIDGGARGDVSRRGRR